MNIADVIQITPETNLAVPIIIVVGMLGSIVFGVWRAANFTRDILEGIISLKKEMENIRRDMSDTWNLPNMKDWANSLERKNRGIPLIVPSPAAIRNGDSLHGESAPPL